MRHHHGNGQDGAAGTEAARLRQVGDRLPGSVLYQAILRPDGRVEHPYMGEGIEALTGVTAAEAMADASVLVNLLHDEDRPRFFAAAMASAETLAPFDMLVRQHTRAGDTRWMLYRSNPQRLSGGSVLWDGVQIDVTDQVREVDRVREEERVRARVEADASASRTMDSHLAHVSHELRAPLTPALALAHTLAISPGLTAEQREYAVAISRWIALEARLIDDLVDHELLAHGTLQLRRARVDVHVPVRHALLVCEPVIAAKRLTLVERFEAADPWLTADPIRLQQIVWNLVQHAARATPPGGRITVRTSAPVAQLLEVSVEDTGVGIAPERLGRLFEPFRHDPYDATETSGGLGIGLSLGRRLAEAHGGTLTAHSGGPGLGATYTLQLPR